MSKKLSEMTLDELWELFPITLTEYKTCWKDYYAEQAAELAKILPIDAIVNHIGGTAVKEIWAKPIVDILVEVSDNLCDVALALQNNGWIKMSESKNRISFNKGYTENGFAERVYHLHLRHFGDNDEIYFRDYLNAHPEVAKAYETLKLDLWKKFEHDRDGYTNAKSEFVAKYTAIAKKMEKWDAYDAQLNKIEGVTLVRGEQIPDGTYHLVCNVLVKHVDGSILIMQRDLRKKYGGMWEATAGGSALMGETPLECAQRELREETGIIAHELSEVGRAVVDERHAIFVQFLCITNWNKDEIALQQGETIAYKWVSRNEILNMKNDELITKRVPVNF